MRVLLIFCIILLMLMCGAVGRVFAEAPTTPKILFTSARDGNREVYIMNPDGSEQVRLTQHPKNDLQAVWSPTGEKILFVSDRGGRRDLYTMNPDGANVRRLFKFKTEEWRVYPTWSPDGKQIAYMRMNWDKELYPIYTVILGEQKSEELVKEGLYPAWSPDRMEVAFSIRGRITFINVHTRVQEQPLPKKAPFSQHQPSWSAAGDKLAFVGKNDPLPAAVLLDKELHEVWKHKQTLFIVNRDGTDLQQLVDEAGPMAENPELSPNGKEILYTQKIKGSLQIFKLNISSGVRTQLTHIGGIFQANIGGDWFDPAYALPVSPQPELLTTTWGELKKE